MDKESPELLVVFKAMLKEQKLTNRLLTERLNKMAGPGEFPPAKPEAAEKPPAAKTLKALWGR